LSRSWVSTGGGGTPAWPGMLVRFSVGLEAVEDLIEDCRQALAALAD
jgi:cystathionine beta-lyase/cystathionine gamma-synthase